MSAKFNVRIRPVENQALATVARAKGLDKPNRLVRTVVAGSPELAAQLRAALVRELPSPDKDRQEQPVTRIPISVRFSKNELGVLRTRRERGETRSDTLRRLLGFREISAWFQPAARASSRRGGGAVITPEGIKSYFRVVDLAIQLEAAARQEGGRL